MAEKSIITQSNIGPLKQALAQQGDSLAYHANESISKAHGFQVWDSIYYDSYGDTVGTKTLKITRGAQVYYVPLTATTLPGQDPALATDLDMTSLLQPGGNCWVTDYATDLTDDARLTLSDLLLGHTQLAYWEAHGGVTVNAMITLDSAGHTVGTYVVKLNLGGQELLLPASDRPNGILQPPRILTNPANATSFAGNKSGQPAVDMSAAAVGTMPITFQWEYSYTPDVETSWIGMTLGGSYSSELSSGYTMYSGSIDHPLVYPPSGTGTSTTTRLTFTSTQPTGTVTAFYVRCKFSNGGVSHTTYASISMSDSTGCFLCTMAHQLRLVSDENLRR